MKEDELKKRTKDFALEIIKLVEKLPKNRVADILGRQILKSGTSIGANYRAVCRARSRADFISKLGIVEEEADETLYWLELLVAIKLIEQNIFQRLTNEANEIVAIVVTSIKTARGNQR
ncbi:MAG: four helix bundle protein [bacterium]|nr:four helix bundle protein [bacterium]